MVNVKIDEDTLIDMLMDRVAFWTNDSDTLDLYEQYYTNAVWGGVFDGAELDVMAIVDNDYVNWLDVITEEDFENYNIEDENDERIVARSNEAYLIYCG